jgi:hypothetical protein
LSLSRSNLAPNAVETCRSFEIGLKRKGGSTSEISMVRQSWMHKRNGMKCYEEALDLIRRYSEANPTIVSYNASSLNVYNAKKSLVHFDSKTIYFCVL